MKAVLIPIPFVALGVFVVVLTPRKRSEVQRFSYARGMLWILLGVACGVLVAVPIAGGVLVVATFILWAALIAWARRAGV